MAEIQQLKDHQGPGSVRALVNLLNIKPGGQPVKETRGAKKGSKRSTIRLMLDRMQETGEAFFTTQGDKGVQATVSRYYPNLKVRTTRMIAIEKKSLDVSEITYIYCDKN